MCGFLCLTPWLHRHRFCHHTSLEPHGEMTPCFCFETHPVGVVRVKAWYVHPCQFPCVRWGGGGMTGSGGLKYLLSYRMKCMQMGETLHNHSIKNKKKMVNHQINEMKIALKKQCHTRHMAPPLRKSFDEHRPGLWIKLWVPHLPNRSCALLLSPPPSLAITSLLVTLRTLLGGQRQDGDG